MYIMTEKDSVKMLALFDDSLLEWFKKQFPDKDLIKVKVFSSPDKMKYIGEVLRNEST